MMLNVPGTGTVLVRPPVRTFKLRLIGAFMQIVTSENDPHGAKWHSNLSYFLFSISSNTTRLASTGNAINARWYHTYTQELKLEHFPIWKRCYECWILVNYHHNLWLLSQQLRNRMLLWWPENRTPRRRKKSKEYLITKNYSSANHFHLYWTGACVP